MIGIFIFKAKPEDKAYKYKKEPKQPLKLTDEELVHFVKTTPKMLIFAIIGRIGINSQMKRRFLVQKSIGIMITYHLRK